MPGIREYAKAHGAGVACLSEAEVEEWLSSDATLVSGHLAGRRLVEDGWPAMHACCTRCTTAVTACLKAHSYMPHLFPVAAAGRGDRRRRRRSGRARR